MGAGTYGSTDIIYSDGTQILRNNTYELLEQSIQVIKGGIIIIDRVRPEVGTNFLNGITWTRLYGQDQDRTKGYYGIADQDFTFSV